MLPSEDEVHVPLLPTDPAPRRHARTTAAPLSTGPTTTTAYSSSAHVNVPNAAVAAGAFRRARTRTGAASLLQRNRALSRADSLLVDRYVSLLPAASISSASYGSAPLARPASTNRTQGHPSNASVNGDAAAFDADTIAHKFRTAPGGQAHASFLPDTPVFNDLKSFETAPFFSLFAEVERAAVELPSVSQPGELDALMGDASMDEEAEGQERSGKQGDLARFWLLLLPLLFIVFVYFCASTASIAFVKLLGYSAQFSLPVFFAIMQKAGLVFNFFVLIVFAFTRESSFTVPSWTDIFKYALVGFFSAGADVCDMFGLVRLPGSTYAILRTADLIFNTLLSRFWLHKRFTLFHYGAVLIVVAGVAVTGVSANAADVIGVVLVLAGCFFEALTTVAADQMLKKSAQQKQDKLRYLFEYTMWVSSFAMLFLVLPLLATMEYATWVSSIEEATKHISVFAFVSVCLGIAVSRLFVRLTKYWIVERRSAFTFSILKPVRRVFSVFVLILLWPMHEKLDLYKGVGMVLTMVGLFSYVYGSRRVSQQQRALLLAEASAQEQRIASEKRISDAPSSNSPAQS